MLLGTISRTLEHWGLTCKKLAITVAEQNKEVWSQYLVCIRQYAPNQLVFVDKSSCDCRTGWRAYGWAPTGTRSRRRECFVRGVQWALDLVYLIWSPTHLSRYSMLPAISLDGTLYLAAQKDAYMSDNFTCFISILLDAMNPYLARNSIIVMDNASIHKVVCLWPMIEQR